jgi:hypothetical protein
VFCGDDSHVMLNTSEGRPGEVRIQLSLSESGRATPCDQPGMMHPVNWPLPTLQAPEGLNVRGGGSMSSSGDGVMTSASYETEMSVEELAAHFAAQVESQDWEPTGVHEDSVVAMRTYTRTSDDGRPLHGMLLIVAPHGARSKEAMFRVVTLARTRRE